jgi:hypothetical protein
MSEEPETTATPEPPAALSASTAQPAVLLTADLLAHSPLSELKGVPLLPDHWHWLYRAPDGSLLAESARRGDELPLLGRFYVQAQTIIVWEPT